MPPGWLAGLPHPGTGRNIRRRFHARRGGYCTAAVYTFLVGIFVYRELTKGKLWSTLESTVFTLGIITLLLGFSTVLTRLVMREGAAQAMASSMIGAFLESLDKYASYLSS